MDRPYVICHMMATLDGKIASGVEGVSLFDDYFDPYLETEEKLQAKAWMCGRVTVQEFTNYVPKNKPQGFMFVVDTKGVLTFGDSSVMLSNGTVEAELVVLVLKTTPKEYLDYLEDKKIKYLLGGENEIDWNVAFKKIKEEYKVERLLLEGGGILNGSVLRSNFVDEISLLLTPVTLNVSGSPSLFENKLENLPEIKKFNLQSVEKLDKDCVWMSYVL